MTIRRLLPAVFPALGLLLLVESVGAAGVVGTGTPGSCTEAALNTALTGGGSVTFNCGASPVVIPITSQKMIGADTTIDGGSASLVILDGGGVTRHFITSNTVPLTIHNLTLRNGHCLNPDPGQTPGYGGSIRSGILSPLTVTDSVFLNNVCDVTGADFGGGAIRQRRGPLLIQRTTFTGNRAGNSGAVSISDSPTVLEDSTFTNNTTNAHTTGFSGVGGAFYVDGSGGGQIVVRRSTFINNTATFRAGAMQTFFYPVNNDQGLVLEDCLFQGNSAPDGPGALLHQDGPMTMTRTTFTGNSTSVDAGAVQLFKGNNNVITDSTFNSNTSVGAAGALWLVDSPAVQITNSTFSGNDAQGPGGFGGALAVYGSSTVSVSHSTFAGNHAGAGGGAIINGSTASTTLRASIFSQNITGSSAGHCFPSGLGDGGFNVQFPAQAGGNCTASILVADPLLGPLANNGGPTLTHALTGASPARDHVTSGCPPPSTDQRGTARPSGAFCDSGAYEASGALSIADMSITEGNAGTASMTFTVTLSEAATQTVTVNYSTANGSATAPADYTATSGTLTFTIGSTTRTFNVPVVGDTLDEVDETFVVNLSSPVGASIADGQAVGTILDNDAPPSVSVSDCVVAEGNTGSAVCPFVATLSAPSSKSITVGYATTNGTAIAGSDYTAAAGTLTFAPGVTSATAAVSVLGDTIDELDETFALNLSSPVNVTIADGAGVGTIDDDDGPTIRVNDVTVTEGNAGTVPATFTLTLSAASVQTVTVDVATSDGTAQSASDYATASGTVTFTPGQVSRPFTVNVNGDTADEPNERFYLNLDNATDAVVADPVGTATIVDDDGGLITMRELNHGSDQREDLTGGADVFVLSQAGHSSWEVLVDGASGDVGVGTGPTVERLAGDLSTILQSSAAVGPGFARSLRWQNASADQHDDYIRVRSTQCSPCAADDVYRLRVYETTYSVPRFNNGGGQVTVLVLQNVTGTAINGTAYFWNPAGIELGNSPFSLPARASMALNTASVSGVAGQSGTITVIHNGRQGDLTGKTVALDAASGFSFDTPMIPKTH